MHDCAFDPSATSSAHRYAVAAVALGLFGAELAWFAQPPPAGEVSVATTHDDHAFGTIRRNTLVHEDSRHRFVFDMEWPRKAAYDVEFRGAWPSTACEGFEVGIEGWLSGIPIEIDPTIDPTSRGLPVLHATSLGGVNMGRYDACFRWRCQSWSPCSRVTFQ